MKKYPCANKFRQTSVALLLGMALLLVSHAVTSQNQKAKITPSTWPYNSIGYYQYVPPGYDTTTQKFPVLFFFHGIGEKGNGTTQLSKVLVAGPPKLIAQGHHFPFIVISPQLKPIFEDWYPWYMDEVVEYVKKTLRVDETRIYVTGLSLGGGGAWRYAESFPAKVAALAPICGHYNNPEIACSAIVKNQIPIWAFHGELDATIPLYRTQNMIHALLACKNPSADPAPILTIYPRTGHKATWDNAYRTDHLLHNPNLYEWLAKQQRMIVKAGEDRVLKLPENSLLLKGSFNFSNEERAGYRYAWSKMSGPQVTIAQSSGLNILLSDMSQGTYVFRFTVTTLSGKSQWDEVTIFVLKE